jgi:hypothetical protein
LSQEITDILANTDYSEIEKSHESREATQEDGEDLKTPEQKAGADQVGKVHGYQEIAMQIGNKPKEVNDENKGKPGRKAIQKPENAKQSVVIRKRATLEPDIDHDDQ